MFVCLKNKCELFVTQPYMRNLTFNKQDNIKNKKGIIQKLKIRILLFS